MGRMNEPLWIFADQHLEHMIVNLGEVLFTLCEVLVEHVL